MKAVFGLGNPGPRYDATRHNVGWWFTDRLSRDWSLGGFLAEGPALTARGSVGSIEVLLAKPQTWMNRSGAALSLLRGVQGFDVATDLLVVVDDVSLPPGKVRFRPGGSAGGHNGLRSIEGVLGSPGFARLRIGVGSPPRGADLADWVLSPMPPADEEAVLDRFPRLVEGVECWMRDGIEAAMSRFNG